MKIFIVFCGLLIINISFLSYQGDMGRYVHSQTFLKAVAEECAAGAALYYDEAAYSDGQFRFNYEEGKKYIEYIIEDARERMPLPENSRITYRVSFQDDNLGYDDKSLELDQGNTGGYKGKQDVPSVTVEISARTEDLFHLPFLRVTNLERKAKYELPQ
jgi:hypothetical protein